MKILIASLVFLLAFGMSPASAHAFLDEATPKVGSTGNASPKELRLHYTEGVEPAFSQVTVAASSGAAVPTGEVSVDPADNSILVVPITGTLAPGLYKVAWAVVAVDTHHTNGTFEFEVGP